MAVAVGLVVVGCISTYREARKAPANTHDGEVLHSPIPTAKTHFLIVGKGKIADSPVLQARGMEAVRKVAAAAGKLGSGTIVDAVAEGVMTRDQYRSGQANDKVTRTMFKDRLRQLAKIATPQDTVVIYTHSHGRRNGFEELQPLGGIVLDLPVRQTAHGGTLLWDEYADLLLKIPARNVVVLTMSCFSGGLIEYLNAPQVKARWTDRRQKEGRNLVILTSQNMRLSSDPIMKDGEIINPFTYAVTKALAGEADGFTLTAGGVGSHGHRDGKLTAGEMIDFILYTTENTISEAVPCKNTAKPQWTGSFLRQDVLLVGAGAVETDGRQNQNATQQGATELSPAPQTEPEKGAR